MATYVLIIKISEDKNTATYGFGPDEENLGKVEFDKLTGEYKKIDTDISISEFYYLTANVVNLTLPRHSALDAESPKFRHILVDCGACPELDSGTCPELDSGSSPQ